MVLEHRAQNINIHVLFLTRLGPMISKSFNHICIYYLGSTPSGGQVVVKQPLYVENGGKRHREQNINIILHFVCTKCISGLEHGMFIFKSKNPPTLNLKYVLSIVVYRKYKRNIYQNLHEICVYVL